MTHEEAFQYKYVLDVWVFRFLLQHDPRRDRVLHTDAIAMVTPGQRGSSDYSLVDR